ncbi:MAG TPA: ABC transporter ATP-binding protein [Pirellulales bacterium]|jgi:ABC-type multidrug transport system fused ATPase/permease subunit|nr:ABC transporter ATP-binding protein [Pirellulales bacterium]
MQKFGWNSFHRTRRFASPSSGAKFRLAAASVAAAVMLVLLLMLLSALADLLVTRGSLEVFPGERAEAPAAAGNPDQIGPTVEYRDRGLLPLVWRLRGTMLGSFAEWSYDHWYALRSNSKCLLALIVVGWSLALAYGLSRYGLERWAQTATLDVVRRLRNDLFQHSTRLGAGDLLLGQRQNVVELFVERIETFATGLVAWYRAVPHAVLVLVPLAIVALWVDPFLALAIILLAALSRLMFNALRIRSQQRDKYWGDRAAQQRATLVEDLRQVRLLANFAPIADQVGPSFETRLNQAHAAAVRQHTSRAATWPSVIVFILAGVGLSLLVCGWNVLHEPPRLSLSGTVLMSGALLAAVFPIWTLRQLSTALSTAEPAAAEIMAYLERQPAVGQVPEAKPLTRPSRDLALAGVTLAAVRGHRLLDDVSLTIPCGSSMGILASDHETPLAMAGLLARFYDPTAGRVLFDGKDIGRATLASVRSLVSLLLPDRFLATGTVTENLSCGDARISAVEVADAARQAHAYEFIQRLPQGFDTIIGPHGFHLAPAEQMLLGWARVVLRNPAIIILGEWKQEFDAAMSEQLAAAAARAIAGRTVIVLARRLPTLRAVERILLFHQGKLHGDGSHIDLLAESELYRHLNYVRFNEFRNQVSGEW